MIAAPSIICRMKKEFNSGQINSKSLQMPDRKIFHCLIVYIDANFFTLSELFYKLTIIRVNGMNFPRPTCFFVGPAQPGSRMRRIFGGKTIAKLFGSSNTPIP